LLRALRRGGRGAGEEETEKKEMKEGRLLANFLRHQRGRKGKRGGKVLTTRAVRLYSWGAGKRREEQKKAQDYLPFPPLYLLCKTICVQMSRARKQRKKEKKKNKGTLIFLLGLSYPNWPRPRIRGRGGRKIKKGNLLHSLTKVLQSSREERKKKEKREC